MPAPRLPEAKNDCASGIVSLRIGANIELWASFVDEKRPKGSECEQSVPKLERQICATSGRQSASERHKTANTTIIKLNGKPILAPL